MIDSRAKGKRAELELIKALRLTFPDAARNLEQFQHTDGRDVSNTPGFCFQLKAGRRPRWKPALQEAIDAAGSDIPVAVTREDRSGFIAHLALGDLLRLVRTRQEGP